MKKRIISTLCALSLLLTLAACSEGEVGAGGSEDAGGSESSRSAQESAAEDARGTAGAVMTGEPVGTAAVTSGSEPGSAGTRERTEPPVVVASNELRLNTELLAEFGMTLSELEVKHGRISDARIDTNSGDHTYQFERSHNRRYGFTEWDGHNREGETRSLDWIGIPARELFWGMENAISDYDVEKAKGLKIDMEPQLPERSTLLLSDYSVASGYYFTTFWHGGHYLIRIAHTKEGVIEPDSMVTVGYYDGIW